MGKLIDLTGQKFGRLTVLERASDLILPSGKPMTRWKCKCDCGNYCYVSSTNLRRGRAKSCGCYQRDRMTEVHSKHGCYKSRIIQTFGNMKQRCYNKNHKKYKYYGGRGITICEEWLDKGNGFMNFYNWAMQNGYKDGLTIDRIDVNGNYEPNNCRWVTMKEQSCNKRCSQRVSLCGNSFSLIEICKKENISYNKAYYKYITKTGEINNGKI